MPGVVIQTTSDFWRWYGNGATARVGRPQMRGTLAADSLPVITIADSGRVLSDRLYAEQVAERLLDYLMRIDDFRGTGLMKT